MNKPICLNNIFLIFLTIFFITNCSFKIDDELSYSNLDNKIQATEELKANIKTKLDTIKEKGFFKAGVRPNVPPFGFFDEKGNRVGFEIDLLKSISKRINLDVEFVDVEFRDIIPLVQDGELDVVAAVVTHKQEREDRVDFSYTYFMDAERFLVKKDSGITKIEDLMQKGRKIATIKGDSFCENIQKKYPEIELLYCEQFPYHYDALEQGLADAVGGDSIMLLGRKKQHFDNPENYIVVGEPLSYAPFGMVIPENESDWRDLINETLNNMFKDGEFDKIYNKWFGVGTDYDMSSLNWSPQIYP